MAKYNRITFLCDKDDITNLETVMKLTRRHSASDAIRWILYVAAKELSARDGLMVEYNKLTFNEATKPQARIPIKHTP